MRLDIMFIPSGGLIQLFMTAFDMVKFAMNEDSRITALNLEPSLWSFTSALLQFQPE
jgi:hypothetical protein